MNKTTIILNLIISSISIVKPIDDSISNNNEEETLKSIEAVNNLNINEEHLSIDINKDDILSKSEILNLNNPTKDLFIDIRYLKEPELNNEEIVKINPKPRSEAPAKSERNILKQTSTKESNDESKIAEKDENEFLTAIEDDSISKIAKEDANESKTVKQADNEFKMAKKDDNQSKTVKQTDDGSETVKKGNNESKTAIRDNDEIRTTKEKDRVYQTTNEDNDESKITQEDDEFKSAKEDKSKRSENTEEISEIESTTKVIDTEGKTTKYLDNPVEEEPEPLNSEDNFDEASYGMDYEFRQPNDESNTAWDVLDDIPFTRRMLSQDKVIDKILKTKVKAGEEIVEQQAEVSRTVTKSQFKTPTNQNIYDNKMNSPVSLQSPGVISAVIQTEDRHNPAVSNIQTIMPMDLNTISNKGRSGMGNIKFMPVTQRNVFKLRVPIEDLERTSEYTESKTIDDFNSDQLRNAYPYVPPTHETSEEPDVISKLIKASEYPESRLSFYPGNVYRQVNIRKIPNFIPYIVKPLNFNILRYPNNFRRFRKCNHN